MLSIDALRLTFVGVQREIVTENRFLKMLAKKMEGSILMLDGGQFGYRQRCVITGEHLGKSWKLYAWYGATNLNQKINIEFKGGLTEWFASFVIDLGVDYEITRVDICYDFFSDFLSCSDICIKYANDRRITTSTSGDWINGQNGRTLYIGKRSGDNESFIRLYEKGIELNSRGADAPTNLIRLEVEIRPQKHKKKIIRTLLPYEILSYFRNPLYLFNCFLDDENIHYNKIDYEPDEKCAKDSFLHMCKQYKNVMRLVVKEEGADFFLAELKKILL